LTVVCGESDENIKAALFAGLVVARAVTA